ncbi:DUF3592 domain-containing protein [uncultured Clostridium sp.]|jgi:uncharacterized membrane protein YjfL (UPF0719 family)|uniref:DUF3592 domain-containing protein n=1 Tax=uncultured Clostridium sp. TaxID=59620 RepID=UPI0026278354|nr:DUF3592 domain-containing protein [uncultured Clostridium sp.]
MATNTNNKNNDKKGSPIFLILFYGFIVFSTLGGIFGFINRSEILFTGQETTATITSFQSVAHTNKGNTSYTYIPVLEFDAYGHRVSVASDLNETDSKLNQIGATLPIKFDKSNPANAVINTSTYTSSIFISSLFDFLVPVVLGFFYALNILATDKKTSKEIPWKNKMKACFGLTGAAIIGIAIIIDQTLNIKLSESPNFIFLGIGIIILIVYFGFILSTIKSYINQTTENYIF